MNLSIYSSTQCTKGMGNLIWQEPDQQGRSCRLEIQCRPNGCKEPTRSIISKDSDLLEQKVGV